jgi:2-iminobutanoate/2-iminopropanoate deaminase
MILSTGKEESMRLFVVVTLGLATVSTIVAQSPKQIISTSATSSRNPLSPAVKAGGFIYVSGTAAAGKGDIRAQTRAALDNISATLKAGGSSIANALSVSIYLRNASDFAGMNEVYSTYWPKDPPARTTVIASTAAADALVEISMIAAPDGAERVVVHPGDWANSPLPYSYGIKSGNTLFLAGLVSRNGKDNTNVQGDLTAQTKMVLDNAGAILKEAGMSYADVVQARVYITDKGNFQAMNAAYRPYFTGGAPPARATVQVGLTSPDYLIEIGMIAVKDPSRTAIATPNADGSPPAKSNPTLSSAIRVGDRLFVAGIGGSTQGNRGDIKAQTAEALARIGRTIKAAGFDWANVVEGMVYLPDVTKFADMNAVYRDVFQKDFPARTTVSTGLMGAGAETEISFIAVK